MMGGVMTRTIRAALASLVAFFTLTTARAVENTWDYSVQVSSVVQASPAKVTLTWPQDTNGTPSSYTVYRRTPGSTNWGSGTALAGSTTSYTDTSVASGAAYEYRIVKVTGSYTSYGYIMAGVNAPLVDSRGKVVLVVDTSVVSALTAELTRLEQDLAGDGWTVVRRNVGRTDSVASVKAAIKSVYDADPANVKSVFLFGHIPVPYSGQLNPDGHPDHVGAWPADAFYGDMDGNWTDSSVNYTQTLNTDPVDAARMSNKPGDGKFDQTQLPSAVELQVGRVDLANLPGRTTWGGPATFPSEIELLRKYLDKDHNFRHRKTTAPRKAILGDYFGVRGGEAFAASGFRSFAPLVGAENIRNLNIEFNDQKGLWIPETAKTDYLLAYACGAGSYASISGIGNGIYNTGYTTELVSSNVRGVFNLLFGSWLGDWDHEDNILRAPLATSTGLVSVWSGRPHWFIHSMGAGETIGHSARLAMNNNGDYQTQINSSQNRIHIALMGDPTLRLHPVAPVGAINGSANGSTIALSWGASNDSALLGYHVYRAASAAGPFTRLTSSPTTATNYSDSNGSSSATYMVRAIKLENTTSGSYENPAQGVFWSATAGSSSSGSSPAVEAPTTTTPTTPVATTPSTATPVSTGANTVTVTATDATAVIGNASDTATLTFARTGDTAAALLVKFALGGSAVKWIDYATTAGDMPVEIILPAGHASATMTIVARANTTGVASPTAMFTLSPDAAYTVGSSASATVNLATAGTTSPVVTTPPATTTPVTTTPSTDTSGTTSGIVTLPYNPNGGTANIPSTAQAPVGGASDVVWFDDALPAGAGGGASGGDTWNWIASSPSPFSGTVSHQSANKNGHHEHYFNWAGEQLSVAAGEKLFLYVYIDPAAVPSEIMVSWCTTNWEHRAYWGADRIASGKKDTASRFYAGPLPVAGQWVRLEVPASAVGVEGASIQGMSFALFDGRASWDRTGKFTGASSSSVILNPPLTTPGTTTPGVDIAWVDDAVPAGAGTGASGGDSWNWVSSNPAPYAGSRAHQSANVPGLHEHFFSWASSGLTVATGEKLYAYVYLDPTSTPTEIMLSWFADNWEHRAYWGADQISYGTTGTASRFRAGDLPAAGQWVRVEVAASAVGLEGKTITGMSFSAFSGRVTWDNAGKSSGTTSTTPPSSGGSTVASVDSLWFDDALPNGASAFSSGGDTWNWVTASPAPSSGTKAHQSTLSAGLHEHSFAWAGTGLSVATGEKLFTYVYLDSTNAPTAIMLSWFADNWEHRAFWGADKIDYGTKGTAGRYAAGALPATGQWVRLEVPASAVGLEGKTITGMSFSTFDGRATFDRTGKATAGTSGGGSTTTPPVTALQTVTIAAPDSIATIGSSTDTATLTFSRTGDTAAPLLVKFALGGTAVKWIDYATTVGDMPVEIILPAGHASATMTIVARANTTGVVSPTATFTLSPDAAYTIGSANTAALTIASSSGSTSGGSGSSGGSTTTPTTPPIVVTPPIITVPTDPTTTTPINAVAENSATRLPQVGDYALRIVSPTIVELQRITTKAADPAPATDWNFVANGTFNAPATSEFAVTVNGSSVAVKAVNFRRRVAYAPLEVRDLRIDNVLILELNSPIADGQAVEVKNPSGALWPAAMQFKLAADPLRYSAAIHVNQEGYVPSLPKKAIVGHYLGNKGELEIASTSFKIVTAATGTTVYSGLLTARKETGYTYSPQPYQKVYQADFSSFTTPGEYQLVVPGLGASLPFLINEGVAMAFLRTYALGVYHQRCGAANEMPYTRFTHAACHMLHSEIPSPQSSYAFTWATIASKNSDAKSNPRHTAPQLKDEASQLYPFVNKGKVDVHGGHHDAGDYSKYTINVAQLVHHLTFTADSIGGAGALDNLGLPESGDGISDLLQEAKHEADYLARLQDADGGFYFIVYPKTREYEIGVNPDGGDQQVVWPKNTSATAASVAALAQIASSPKFKAAYPAESAAYLAKAKAGWTFLTNAVAKYGKDGSYQKVTFYGQEWLHDDEFAWAAAELFAATGEAQYQQALMEWFPNPSDPATFRWGWWRMCERWGNAIRAYAFAARSGRIPASQLNAAYLAKCEEQIKLAGDDALSWTNKSAYPTAFPQETKNVQAAGWYFSLDQASEMAVAYQLNPKAEYVDALVGNMNYEGGTNPVNVTYLTGLGAKRQHEIVHQWSFSSRQSLPMIGIPLGNVQASFDYLANYGASGNELSKLSFPSDDNSAANRYPFYDRWADTWNVTTEFVTVNQSRAIVSMAMLAAQTNAKSTAWKSAAAVAINVPAATVPVGVPLTLTLNTAGLDLSGARIVWEARDQRPDFGSTYTFSPKNNGPQWAEVEITWPDGRRAFGTATFKANSPSITWVDDAIPAGAITGGNEPWNWVTSLTPPSGTKAHQSALASGVHEHAFMNATNPLLIEAGDKLFVHVYLDASNMPDAIMLNFNDGSSWEHRAFWGANTIGYGTPGTASRYKAGELPAGGQWVRLEVSAAAVGLEGKSISGMSFTACSGRVTWDAVGKTSPMN